jgi:oxygen-independent coproporphyrinogen-3 oxidase
MTRQSNAAANPLALYIHWPWCLAKCPYCDFNSRALKPSVDDQAAYRAALLAELNHFAALSKGRRLSSLFFGGGTPSLIDPATVDDIINTAQALWGLEPTCEITLEANPTSVETSKFRDFRAAGINRVSIGVQALNDEALHQLGREHSAQDAVQSLDIAAAIFDRFTFDIIYARPGQGLGMWHDELEHALDLCDGHISLYQLSIEPGTAFFRSGIAEATPDVGADFYELTQDITTAAGLPAYEISNHARAGEESRHNLTYWRGGDYLGVGPGAHGRLTQDGVCSARHQIADPARWMAHIKTHGHGTAKTRKLSALDRIEERILTGLRMSEGIDRLVFCQQTGQDITHVVNRDALAVLQDQGLVTLDQHHFAVTAPGRLVLSAILEKLLS